MTAKPWDGRFTEKTNELVEAFTVSIETDKRLYQEDIEGSMAHCQMLAKQGIITNDEAQALIQGLQEVKADIEQGSFKIDPRLEDIHMHIETALAHKIGNVALKLHTARSRNDQVALDVRMYLRKQTSHVLQLLHEFRKTIVQFAKEHLSVILPGYTHLQRAQPVLLSHHMMAYYEMFTRDAERFSDGLKRINVMPLGSAALAGTTYPIDRDYTAALLNFPKVSSNSMDAVSDRDFIIEWLASASICMVHLSRLSEEMILWSTSEFGFIEISDAFTTGSSIMPQKKNPDVPELVRGKTGRVFGNLMAVLTLMKGLPLAYNRDMQEDKPLLFDTIDTLTACIEIFIHMLPKVKVKPKRMYESVLTGYLNATDMADYLAHKGMPFREAHSCVGKIVKFAIEKHVELNELSLEDLKQFSLLFELDIFNYITVDEMINRRMSLGGTALDRVQMAIQHAESILVTEKS
ncbi:MAG: argininosuccinate lyase [Desulfobacterales bacterium]|nr:argininosuccinate lyase [Desulfobacterales bacterium]